MGITSRANLPVRPAAEVESSTPLEARTHKLKCWPEFFGAVLAGAKRHELRLNDRGFAVGDTLTLREYDPASATYSGRECDVRVSWMTSAELPCAISQNGLAPGYCILSIEPPSSEEQRLSSSEASAGKDALDAQ